MPHIQEKHEIHFLGGLNKIGEEYKEREKSYKRERPHHEGDVFYTPERSSDWECERHPWTKL